MSTENGQQILMEDTFGIRFAAKAWGCSIKVNGGRKLTPLRRHTSTRSELKDAESSTRTSGT